MVSNSHRFVFARVPKTASRSLYEAVKEYLDPQSEIKHHKLWGKVNYRVMKYPDSEYFSFIFVRNPFDRILSAYLWQRVVRPDRVPDSFKEWLLGEKKDGMRSFMSMPCRKKQMYWAIDPTTGMAKVDFIGRFETLQTDFDYICDRIGIPRKILLRTHKTEHTNYRDYYDREAREFIEDKFKADLDYLKYEF
jgi:hypothetical protein